MTPRSLSRSTVLLALLVPALVLTACTDNFSSINTDPVEPTAVPEGSGEFGNLMIQVIAGAMFLSGAILGGGAALSGELGIISGTVGLLFLSAGFLLFFTVANARLSDRFRAEEYRNRLRAVGVGADERPEFLPESARETATVPDESTEEEQTAAEPPEPPAEQ